MHLRNRLSKTRAVMATLLLAACGVAHADVNYYECVDLGFVDHTFKTKAGVVATTNRGTDIMLLKDNKLQSVVTGPGAGMYVNVSADGQYIGFKSINNNADQAPALYDVVTGKVTLLEDYANQCGQVSFANDGTMAYTVGNTLYVRKGTQKRSFDLGMYVNIANISPDASRVAFSSLEGQLYILTLATGHFDQVAGEGSYNPIWSPDAQKLAVQQVNGQVFTFDSATRATRALGEASSVSWTEDSKSLVFTRSERINELQVKGASVMKVNYDGTSLQTLVATTEATPVAVRAEGNNLVVSYANGEKRGVSRIAFTGGLRAGAPAKEVAMATAGKKERIGSNLVTNFKGFARRNVLKDGPEKEMTEAEIEASRVAAMSSAKGNDIGLTAIPYINQVWDTPSSHDGNYAYGYVCCAPSSSCMLLGWLGYLNPYNVTSRSSYAAVKTCKYSWYVGRQYTSPKTNVTFSTQAQGGGYWGYSYNVRGGYGYMWGNGSPATMMAKYHTNNGVASSYFASSLSTLRTECGANRPYIICLANGTGGHVVIVFRADQQAANDGSSTWAKSGSFICHDPYGDYNSSSYPNWDGRYSTYDWPGVNNGKANIGTFYWGCVSKYSGSTPGTKNPSITVSPENVHFSCKMNEHPTMTVKVTGKDLDNKITIGSITPGRFATSVTELPATGGSFTITFAISDKAGTYKQGGTAIDYNFFVRVKSGSVEKLIGITADVTAPPLSGITEKYCYSASRGNASQLGYDVSKIRNFCYNKGKLYCVYNHSEILVLNAQTGAKLGTLSNGSVVGPGTLKLCDVKVIDDVIVACNIATKANNEKLRLYAWESDNVEPYLLYETDDFQGAARLGDCLEMTGNFKSDCWFAFANDASGVTRIVEYNRKDGKWLAKNTPVYGTNSKQYACGATVRAYPKSSGWWIDGKNSQPAWTTWDESLKGAKVQTNCTVPFDRGSSHHEFYWKGQKYATNMVFADNTGSSCKMRIIADNTGNFSSTTEIGQYPSDGLGGANNTNGTGDIMVNTDGENYLETWILSTAQGLAYFTTGNVPAINPDPITPPVASDPTMSADKSQLSFECGPGESATADVNITAANLHGNINAAISGADANVFVVSPLYLSATGKLTVHYNPQVAGTHNATLTISSPDLADINIALTGKCETSRPPFTDVITKDKLEEVWIYSPNHTMGDWHVSNASVEYTRSIAVNNGKLYVLMNKPFGAPKVFVVDAYTGQKVGELSTAGIAGGWCSLASLCVIDGKLYGSNAARANGVNGDKITDVFKIYRWDNDTANPVCVLEDASHLGVELGAKINFIGSGANGRIYSYSACMKKLVYYDINNGNINASAQGLDLKATNGAAFNSAYDAYGTADVVDNGDGTFWVVCKDVLPTRFGTDGKAIENIPAEAVNGVRFGSAMRIMPFGSKKYVALSSYKPVSPQGSANGQMTLVDITNTGLAGAGAPVATVPEAGLGATANDHRFQQIQHAYRADNKVLDMWVLSTKQGVAHYKFDPQGWTGVKNISVDGEGLSLALNGRTINVVEGEAAAIHVITLSGAVVACCFDQQQMDLDHLAAGIYVVVATDRNGHKQAIKVALR